MATAKRKPRKRQFMTSANFAKYLRHRQHRDAHLKLRLCRSGSLCFGWLRPDEIKSLPAWDINIDECALDRAKDDERHGIATLRPVWFDMIYDSDFENIPVVDSVPQELLNYDNIKNWWHGFQGGFPIVRNPTEISHEAPVQTESLPMRSLCRSLL